MTYFLERVDDSISQSNGIFSPRGKAKQGLLAAAAD